MPGSNAALSSRGLGRRPLTAVTRVRIPLGLPKEPCSHGFLLRSTRHVAPLWHGAIRGGTGRTAHRFAQCCARTLSGLGRSWESELERSDDERPRSRRVESTERHGAVVRFALQRRQWRMGAVHFARSPGDGGAYDDRGREAARRSAAAGQRLLQVAEPADRGHGVGGRDHQPVRRAGNDRALATYGQATWYGRPR